MEQELEQIIRKSKKKLSEQPDNSKYKHLNTFCLLVPDCKKILSFSLKIISGAGIERGKKGKEIIFHEESFPITVELYKIFMQNSFEKYKDQFFVCLPHVCTRFYGIWGNPTIADLTGIIDYSYEGEDWSLFIPKKNQNVDLGFWISEEVF